MVPVGAKVHSQHSFYMALECHDVTPRAAVPDARDRIICPGCTKRPVRVERDAIDPTAVALLLHEALAALGVPEAPSAIEAASCQRLTCMRVVKNQVLNNATIARAYK